MIKASYWKHPGVIAAISAAQAYRQAAKVASYYEIKEKKKLISFYHECMRDWAMSAIKCHKILTRHD